MIDEVRSSAAAAVARGTTTVRDAGELAVKESNRIKTTCDNLRALGGKAEERPDGMVVEVPEDSPGNVASFGDHPGGHVGGGGGPGVQGRGNGRRPRVPWGRRFRAFFLSAGFGNFRIVPALFDNYCLF